MKKQVQNLKTLRFWFPVAAVAFFWSGIWGLNIANAIPRRTPPCFRYKNAGDDFGSLYAGAIVSTESMWNDLYAGTGTTGSDTLYEAHPSERLRNRLEARKAKYRWAWLYPPPATVLFAPFAVFDYPQARHLWMLANFAALLCLIWLTRTEMIAFGQDGWTSGLLLTASGCSLPVAYNFLYQNTALFVALALLVSLRGIRLGRIVTPAVSIVFLGVLKGFSVVWVPFIALWRRWRLATMCVLVSALLLGTAFCLGCRWQPYSLFLQTIVPASRDPSRFGTNDSFLWIAYSYLNAGTGATKVMIVMFPILLAGLFLLSMKTHRNKQFSAETIADADGITLVTAFLLFQQFSAVSWMYYKIHVIAMLPVLLHACSKNASWPLASMFTVSMILLWTPTLYRPIPAATGYALLIAFGFTALAILSSNRNKDPTDRRDRVQTTPVLDVDTDDRRREKETRR